MVAEQAIFVLKRDFDIVVKRVGQDEYKVTSSPAVKEDGKILRGYQVVDMLLEAQGKIAGIVDVD